MTEQADAVEQERRFQPRPPTDLQALYDKLKSWPANGKPEYDDNVLIAHSLGYVENVEVKKHCPSCGAPKYDYSYMKITPAGRFFMAAMEGKSHVD